MESISLQGKTTFSERDGPVITKEMGVMSGAGHPSHKSSFHYRK